MLKVRDDDILRKPDLVKLLLFVPLLTQMID